MSKEQELSKYCQTAIRTTMIGSLDTIEDKLGHMWGNGSLPATSEEQAMREVFQEIRSEILGKGNDQIRNVEAKFDEYKISKKVNSINIPVLRNK